jgi:hypothetical protein
LADDDDEEAEEEEVVTTVTDLDPLSPVALDFPLSIAFFILLPNRPR